MRLASLLMVALAAFGATPSERELGRQCLKELIEIDTTDSAGDNTRAAEAVAKRLRAAGFPERDVRVVVPAPKKGNLVARLRGTGGARPVLLLGHIDVVEARRSDWSFSPFTLIEKDGYFYGRGTQDMKSDDALLVASFIRLKREGFRPARDLILALTADEEGGRGPNGAAWLLEHERPLIDAEYCLNADAGGGQVRAGKRTFYTVQSAEKSYATFKLRAANPGGHSSLPVPKNAIYQIADALERVRAVRFTATVNAVTRSFFDNAAAAETGQSAADLRAVASDPPDAAAAERLSASPYYNALLHTTCVATQLAAGHAENALPQTAEATVNCRLLPGDTVAHVTGVLRDAVAGTGVELTTNAQESPNPASPWPPPFFGAVRKAAGVVWPGVPVTGAMETGFTDGSRFRRAGIPAYGISGLFLDVDDIRAHGRDERVPVEAFYQGLDYTCALLKAVGSEPSEPVRPKILGLAGMGVTVSDLERSRAFYRDFLGLAETPGNPSRMRIGGNQYVELIPGPLGKDGRLDHVAFYTSDAAAMRRYLAAHGVEGDAKDADGHAIRFVERPRGSAAAAEGAISDHMQHAGFTVGSYEPAMQFYRDLLGFRTTWKGSTGPTVLNYVNMQVPDGGDFVEYILYGTIPPPEKRGSANHICLLVPDMAKAVAALEARRARVGYTRPIEIAVGRNHRRQANLYDPDGTRTEIMEPGTVDGLPSPWSEAPPPR